MTKATDLARSADSGDDSFSVGDRVLVHAGTPTEARGQIVDDFGASAGQAVDIGTHHIADAGRRWAIAADSGALIFADSGDLTSD